MTDIDGLIKKYEDRLIQVVNPDDLDWEGLGFSEKPEEYDTEFDFLLNDPEIRCEFGTEDQISIMMLQSFIQDLRDLKNH